MRRILVVDDDLQHRSATGLIARHCWFRVAITDSGTSGLGALDDGMFDLMIVDVFMPNMRGFKAIRIWPGADRAADRDFRSCLSRHEAANIWRERVNTG